MSKFKFANLNTTEWQECILLPLIDHLSQDSIQYAANLAALKRKPLVISYIHELTTPLTAIAANVAHSPKITEELNQILRSLTLPTTVGYAYIASTNPTQAIQKLERQLNCHTIVLAPRTSQSVLEFLHSHVVQNLISYYTQLGMNKLHIYAD
jgi:Flp pilus assembly protein TadG